MIDAIEELRQININGNTPLLFNDLLHLLHCLLSIATWPEAEAVLAEQRVKNRCEHLGNGLLDREDCSSWRYQCFIYLLSRGDELSGTKAFLSQSLTGFSLIAG